jgi:SAM-dependent methyltransferase
MGVSDKLRELRWRRAGHYDRPLPPAFLDPVREGRILEVGGPSAVFRADGLLPVYRAAASVDGVQWSVDTLWHGHQQGAYILEDAPAGTLHVADGATLDSLPGDAFDAVVSSHVIEHLANPLGALAAWRRVGREGAGLVLVAPHMEGTFDHRRPVTPLAHMVADLERGTGEDDLTHLGETLRLHDRSRDVPDDAWEARRRENVRHRVLHHHVFTTRSLVELLVAANVEVTAVQTRHPHDIYLAGRFAKAGEVTIDLAGALRASPFRIDREDAARPTASAPAGAR